MVGNGPLGILRSPGCFVGPPTAGSSHVGSGYELSHLTMMSWQSLTIASRACSVVYSPRNSFGIAASNAGLMSYGAA